MSSDYLDEEFFHGFHVLGGDDGLVGVRLSESEDIPFGNDADEKRFRFGLGWGVEDGNVADFVFVHESEKIADSVVESQELDLSGHNIGGMAHRGQGDAEGRGDLVCQIEEVELRVFHVQFSHIKRLATALSLISIRISNLPQKNKIPILLPLKPSRFNFAAEIPFTFTAFAIITEAVTINCL